MNDDVPDPLERLIDLDHLAAGIGHHVINSFSAIVSNAEVLRLASLLPESIDPISIAEMIIKNSVDASVVARHLIDYTRPPSANHLQRTDLSALVAEVVTQERLNAPSQIQWKLDLKPVPPILSNPTQLRRMLSHLIANAREALGPDGGRIELATGVDPRGWVMIELRDSGQGMTPEVQQLALQPFFTTKPGRYGVGLTIANGIWRRHRGTLSLQSTSGIGTEIRLSVEPDEDPPPSDEASGSNK